MAATAKEAGELEDEDVMAAREALEAANLNPDEGAFYTGVIFAHTVETGPAPGLGDGGGLNRINLMRAVWNADFTNPLGLEGGTYQTDGTNDAYLVEAAEFVRYARRRTAALGRYEPVGDLIDIEGQTGSVGG